MPLFKRRKRPTPHGPVGIDLVGHRDYVGGMWETIGALQFAYLKDAGLEPRHVLFDVACGSLRGGVHFIPYLDAGNYCGIDKERALIDAGLRDELDDAVRVAKRPRLVVSEDFAFERFGVHADYAIAQSLLTHLPPELCTRCLSRLRPWMRDGGLLCATFFPSDRPVSNPGEPHDHGRFEYTPEEFAAFGTEAGWRAEYVGDWRHPRGQHMMHFWATERRSDGATQGGRAGGVAGADASPG